MLLSCPLKNELRAFFGVAPVEHAVPKQAAFPQASSSVSPSLEANCSTEFGALDKIDLGSVQAAVQLKSPFAFVLAFALPVLLLLLFNQTVSSLRDNGSVSLLSSIPLFLRLRKIIV